MSRPANSDDYTRIAAAVARLRAGVLAIVCGLLAGCGLTVATVWLILRGGANVGQHLSLLANYLPGYSVTWPGAALGFFYGLVLGGMAGWLTAFIYNQIVNRRHPSSSYPVR